MSSYPISRHPGPSSPSPAEAKAQAPPPVQGRRTSHYHPADPMTRRRDRSAAEQEFLAAIQVYKVSSGRKFLTWSEVFQVAHGT